MTNKQYRIFNKITKTRQKSSFIICFKTLLHDSYIDNDLMKKLNLFNSILFSKNDYEEFFQEYISSDDKVQVGIQKLKNVYLKECKVPFKRLAGLFNDIPESFNDFYLWIKNEVLPQFNKYNINKNTIT